MTAEGSATVAILMYHGFSPAATAEFRRFVVEPSLFDEQLAALGEAGCRFIPVREVPEALRTAKPDELVVAVSIDDGFADGIEAADILTRHRVRATYFIPTKFVGGTALWLDGAETSRPLMTWQDLDGLARAGMEIASHGHGHIAADLNRRAVVRADAERSRSEFEQHLGLAVSSYAYPFGFQRPAARRAVAAAGFACACAIFGLPATRSDDVYALPRLEIGPNHTPELLTATCRRRWRRYARFESYQRQRVWTAARRVIPLGPDSSRRTGEQPARGI